MGIDSSQEAIVFMRSDCHICRSEGFDAHARVKLSNGGRVVVATLYQVTSDLLAHGEAGLSETPWRRLDIQVGDKITSPHVLPARWM
jgi:thymidine phosphorylase